MWQATAGSTGRHPEQCSPGQHADDRVATFPGPPAAQPTPEESRGKQSGFDKPNGHRPVRFDREPKVYAAIDTAAIVHGKGRKIS